MKKILLIATFVFIAISCDKNQNTVKKLDGTWKATKFASTDSTGVTIDLIGFVDISYQFDGCKLKNDEYCNMTTTTTTNLFGVSTTTTELDSFRVIDDGSTLEVKTGSSSITMTILELTNKSLKVKQVENNTIVNIEATKTN